MSAIVLAQNISNSLKSSIKKGTESALMNSTIAKEITTYLLSNAKVQVSYTGVIPGTPPVTEMSTDLMPIQGSVTPVGTFSDGDQWLDALGKNISVGFVTLPNIITPISPHISLQVQNTQLSKFVPKKARESVHKSSDPCLEFWKQVANGIFQMINTQISKPFAAKLAGTGVATVIKLMVM